MPELEHLFVDYLNTDPIKVDTTGCKTVADFLEKTLMEVSAELEDFPIAKLNLHLYSGTKLKGDMKIYELVKPPFYNDVNTPLLIRYSEDVLPAVKKPKTIHHSEERRIRWEELNYIIIQAEIDAAENTEEENLKESLGLNWSLISPVYDQIIHEYSQPVKEVPQGIMDLLHRHLATATRLYGGFFGSWSKRRFFISPILVYVTDLFGPEDSTTILIDEELQGDNVKAKGNFLFMIKRKNKRICIVEAKKDDMAQGMAQDLVGMEVVSDLNGLDTVYGIVTNYVEWMFLKSHNDKIERDMDTLSFEKQVATVESLKRIAGKIYALLSDD